MEKNPKVLVLRDLTYAQPDMEGAAEKILGFFGGPEAILHKGKRVLLKVNLLLPREPEEATTTHPALVAALAKKLVQAGGAVTIADSPGGPYTEGALRRIYRACGMLWAAEESGALLNYQCAYDHRTYLGSEERDFEIIQPVFDADVIFSVAKMKNHVFMDFTGAVKNMFGCIPGLTKPAWHSRLPDRDDFGRMLVDLYECVSPDYAVIDGITGMDGKGPSGGRARTDGVLIAGENGHAVDRAALHLIGRDWRKVPTAVAAADRGLVPEDFSRIDLCGDATPLQTPYIPPSADMPIGSVYGYFPKPIRRWLMRRFLPFPKILGEQCVGCGKCAESCPKGAAVVRDGKAAIDKRTCIQCYCCHEMCPVKAIRL